MANIAKIIFRCQNSFTYLLALINLPAIMSSPLERWIAIKVTINPDHPDLLYGLEYWLELGLISQEQVKQLCKLHLSQPLPLPPPSRVYHPHVRKAQPPIIREPQTTFTATLPPNIPPVITRLLQSFKAELSVRWLLFLGLFMVVVSSGVLAASQWERFPAFAQYTVLLAYTLAFWGGSQWTEKQNNLTLTAATLCQVTLLLIPLNFWAMDGLGLWGYPLGWITIAIATFLLSTTTIKLYSTPSVTHKLQLANLLLISYLHWGWSWSTFPIIAIYSAVIITASISLYSRQQLNQQPLANRDIALLIYSLIIILGRGIFVAEVPLDTLGLAVGICGWLIYSFSSPLINRSGYGLLILGWLISLISYPGHAFVISALVIYIWNQHLRNSWRRRDLLVIFAIGLQMIWLLGLMIPSGIRQTAIINVAAITNSQNYPWSLLSLTWFPYLILMLAVTEWLYQIPKRRLALFGEKIALLLGVVLALLGVINPLTRSLNLIASTLTLAVVTKRRTYHPFRVYLTHITALLAVVSSINWLIPTLNYTKWAIILLLLMLGEFGLSIASHHHFLSRYDTPDHSWGKSGFYLGLVLAGCSYLLLSNSIEPVNLIWLITPLGLTFIAKYGSNSQQKQSAELAIVTTVVAQLLTVQLPVIWAISLGISTVIIAINSYYIRRLIVAAIALGFGLSFLTAILWELQILSNLDWLLVNAITLGSLWILRHNLLNREALLAKLYRQAADLWATSLAAIQLLLLTFHSLSVFQQQIQPSLLAVLVIALTVAAIAFRTQTATLSTRSFDNGIYGTFWGIQLLVSEILGFLPHSLILLAIANTALGIIVQIGGDWWQQKHPDLSIPQSLQVIPLLYGILGSLLRFNEIAVWTGLNTLGFALILIGVGRRQYSLKPLVYLGIVGVSIAAGEMLFQQVSYQSLANQLVAFTVLTTSFVYLYRILSSTLARFLHLVAGEITAIAHCHWLIASVLLVISCFLPGNSSPLVGLGSGILLSRYAIVQGRIQPHQQPQNIWVYVGLLQAVAIVYYVIDVLNLGNILFPWIGAIASIIAYYFYISPWENWGWSQTPWRRYAVVLPIGSIAIIHSFINPPQLTSWYIATVITAIFYVFLAELSQNIRFTYLSLFLLNWVILKAIVATPAATYLLWIVTPPALSMLYILQVEPYLKGSQRRPLRHLIRILSISLICVISLLESQWVGIIPGIISLIAIGAGLTIKTRAFLYIGTATFIINIVNQLIILNSVYSFIKWIVVFIGGLMFIWGAANFETRRDQILSLFQNSLQELDRWE
ncbi:hypothetical protein H6G58_16305 [Arthrospira platensis FACHB-971]|nr:hypothetical protein AP285_04090 [Arthrospira platensis YZ]MBD2574544.1 hypothetical protein [Arthrospira platensis FACHB-971]MBD2670695.1 hypothetical protein [Arthrospira platensis FACHB-439]MBD2711628.1 hypothetical protein [Arthrospira platensis FACHB-835]BAI88767.1 hypothetical protein NIES39_B00100 [Arthrospira platensis NIES-39]